MIITSDTTQSEKEFEHARLNGLKIEVGSIGIDSKYACTDSYMDSSSNMEMEPQIPHSLFSMKNFSPDWAKTLH